MKKSEIALSLMVLVLSAYSYGEENVTKEEKNEDHGVHGIEMFLNSSRGKDPENKAIMEKMIKEHEAMLKEEQKNPATVLLLPFQNATGKPELNSLQKGIPDLLNAFLAPHSDVIQIVDREKLDAIMAEKGLKWENMTKDNGMTQLHGLEQAHYLLGGNFTSKNNEIRIVASLYETETTQLLKSIDLTGERKELNFVLEEIASEMASFLLYRPVGMSIGLTQLPSDPNPEMNLHLMYGLAYYQNGQYTKAFPEFMKILAQQPKDADAKYWLGKSFLAAGLKAQADIEFNQFLIWFAKDSRVSEVQGLMKN